MKKIDKNGLIKPFIKGIEKFQYTRSQDLPNVVICDGYVDISRVTSIKKYKKIVCGNIFAYHRENNFCDIDTEDDWKYAEYLIKIKHGISNK